MKKGTLYQHKSNRDTAFKLIDLKKDKRAIVEFYLVDNVTLIESCGRPVPLTGEVEITLKPESEYKLWTLK